MLILVGESASGKSTIEKILCKEYGYKKVTSYTTRSPRVGEKDGVDYHFITAEEFKEKQKDGFFAEVGEYNGWFYGSAVEDCTNDKVAVLTPHGMRQLRNKADVDIFCVYIKVPRRDRLIKILQRNDNIEEAKRRDASDVGQFDGIVSNPPYVTSAEMLALEPSVRRFEPHLALDGGEDGLKFYRAIAANYAPLLKPGGVLCLEFGMGQEQAVAQILEDAGLRDFELRKDYRGVVRAICGSNKTNV